MAESKLISQAVAMIERAYREMGYSLGWRFLYSPQRTMAAETKIFFVGLNPGGEVFSTPQISVEEGNAYRVETRWTNDGIRLQTEVCSLFKGLAAAMGKPADWTSLMDSALTSNFCPFRSGTWETLPRKKEASHFSSELWKTAVKGGQLYPSAIFCNGLKTLSYFKEIFVSVGCEPVRTVELPTDWGAYTFLLDYLKSPTGSLLLVGLPHLSRFRVFTSQKCAHASQGLLSAVASNLLDNTGDDNTPHHQSRVQVARWISITHSDLRRQLKQTIEESERVQKKLVFLPMRQLTVRTYVNTVLSKLDGFWPHSY